MQYVSYPSLHWVFQEKVTLGKRRIECYALRHVLHMYVRCLQKLEPAKFIAIHIENRAATIALGRAGISVP